MNGKIFRESTVKLLRQMLSPLLGIGVISPDEFDLTFTYLSSLAKRGSPPPEVTPRLIRAPEVADLLAISYAEFRKLESEGAFPFKRRVIGKSVRYYYPDVVNFLRSEGLDEGSAREGNDEKKK